nr:MAG TPA: tRNA methyltransferase [Caudoviricetes sp.]DAW40715.1 MAG TPA: tRNA methyltransferase [Caudoviricetes sp.]
MKLFTHNIISFLNCVITTYNFTLKIRLRIF